MQSMSIALPGALPGKRASRVLASSFFLACLIEALCVGGGVAWLLAAAPPPSPAPMAALTQVMTIEDTPAPAKPVITPPAPATPPVPEKPTPVVKSKTRPAAAPHKAAVQPMSVPSASEQPMAEAVAPPVEATPPTPAVPAPSARADLAFAAAIRQAVQSAVRYPAVARMKKQTGRAQVAFSYHDGSVANVRIVVSSMIPALDHAATEAVHDAVYPTAPKELAGLTQDYLVWVEFTNAER